MVSPLFGFCKVVLLYFQSCAFPWLKLAMIGAASFMKKIEEPAVRKDTDQVSVALSLLVPLL